jgi:hypothetical protein
LFICSTYHLRYTISLRACKVWLATHDCGHLPPAFDRNYVFPYLSLVIAIQEQQPLFCSLPPFWSGCIREWGRFYLEFWSKLALKVLPGLMPMFSVRKSYSPDLIFSLMTTAEVTNACSMLRPVFAEVS